MDHNLCVLRRLIFQRQILTTHAVQTQNVSLVMAERTAVAQLTVSAMPAIQRTVEHARKVECQMLSSLKNVLG